MTTLFEVIGVIALIVGVVVAVIGLILMIFKKTRKKGKSVAFKFGIVFICGLLVVIIVGRNNSYPNDEPGTITKAQFNKIKEGMSMGDVKKILGAPSSKVDDINEWSYKGIDGNTPDADVTFDFDPDGKLEVKDDGGLISDINSTPTTNSVPDTSITKDQYQNIKIGMSNEQVKKIVKEPKDKTDSTWNYTNSDSSSADVTFDNKSNKVTEKSEIGILSDSSETITDKNGTRKDDRLATSNSEYADDVSSDAEDAVGNIEWDGKKKDVVRKIEVNDNLGKNDGSKLILMYLNAPITGTNKAITDIVNQDTLKIAKSIKADSMVDFKINSMTFFWYLPLTDQYGNTKVDVAYKVVLENGTLKKINFSHLNDVDLPIIADQYNVTYKQ